MTLRRTPFVLMVLSTLLSLGRVYPQQGNQSIPPTSAGAGITTPGGSTVFNSAIRIVCNSLASSAGWAGVDVSVWIANAQADLPAAGGTVDATSCTGAQAISQQIDVGVTNGSKAVLLKLPPTGTWTATMTGGIAYAIMVHNKSAALGTDSGEGIPFAIVAGASSNLDSVCGTDPTPTGGGAYINMGGFGCDAIAGATGVNAVLNVQALYDVSHIHNMRASTTSTTFNKVFWGHGLCCGTKVEMINGEGFGTAGAIPCTIGKTAENLISASIGPLSCVHAGAGLNNVAIVQAAVGGVGNYFGPIYTEILPGSADTTTASIGITGGAGRPFILDGVALGVDAAGSTRPLVDIGSGVTAILRNLQNGLTSPNMFNDHNSGRGTSAPGTSAFVKEYITSNNALWNPTISSGFGTSPSIPTIGSLGGPISFSVNVGTGGAATGGVIGLPGTINGYNCQVFNLTAHLGHRADDTVQTASAVNTVTVENQTKSTGAAVAWTASDIVNLVCQQR